MNSNIYLTYMYFHHNYFLSFPPSLCLCKYEVMEYFFWWLLFLLTDTPAQEHSWGALNETSAQNHSVVQKH